jgi:hypothetical protein
MVCGAIKGRCDSRSVICWSLISYHYEKESSDVAISSEQFSQQLAQFGKNQLADISTRKICNTTVHLILATAFFTGASIGLAKATRAPKKAYITALQQLLEENFGLSEKNAAGMVAANARLYKRYKLIEKIYNAGWQAAQSWVKNNDETGNTLKALLEEYHDLDMSSINIDGTKEEKTAPPPEVEAIAHVEPVHIAPPRRWGRLVFWLLLILTIEAAAAYFWFFPEQLPLDLLPKEFFPAKLHSFIQYNRP